MIEKNKECEKGKESSGIIWLRKVRNNKLFKFLSIFLKEALKVVGGFVIVITFCGVLTILISYVPQLIIYVYNYFGSDFAYSFKNEKTVIYMLIFITGLFISFYAIVRAIFCFMIDTWKELGKSCEGDM